MGTMEHLPYSHRLPHLPRKSELPPAPDIDPIQLTEVILANLEASAVAEKEMFLDDLYYMCAEEFLKNPDLSEYNMEDFLDLLRLHGVFVFEQGDKRNDLESDKLKFLGVPVLSIKIDENKTLPIELDKFDNLAFQQQLSILIETLPNILKQEERNIQQKISKKNNPLRDLDIRGLAR
jgi:hypothetical protein